MFNIFVSNDDGIEATGIRRLVLSLANYAKVYVAAPASQQSAKSMGITPRGQFHVTETRVPGAELAWTVDGTPADCTKFGLQMCREHGVQVDYMISGVNHGGNLGMDTHYSGTVAAAYEGALQGINSIALSVSSHEAEHFDYICDLIPEILRLSDEVGPEVILNVNSPNLPSWDIKGVKLTAGGGKGFDLTFEKEESGCYHYTGELIDYSDCEDDIDNVAVKDGYVAVTPLAIDRTDHRSLQSIRRLTTDKVVCVFIDYQERLMPAVSSGAEVIVRTAKFARCAKALGLPVIITQQYTKGLGPTVPEVHNALNGQYEKVEKVEFSCMISPDFMVKMEAVRGKTVVLLGVESHICVQQTALDLIADGFDVVVIEDCCSSRSMRDHDVAMRLLADAGCRVTTYESFIYSLMGTSKHRQFKTISKIVTE